MILLVSIAVLEYVLRQPAPDAPRDKEIVDKKAIPVQENRQHDGFEPSLAPSLIQLGRAVEQFGRGPIPQSNPQPQKESTPEKGKV
jgi:hypothetical protein